MVGALKSVGPSGFLQIGEELLVVDYGKIYRDQSPVGFLYEDGLIHGSNDPKGVFEGVKFIEQVSGCSFRGIDANGLQLELPGPKRGPTGGLTYNKVPFNVFFGRISGEDHRVIGELDDKGQIVFRDILNPSERRVMDEHSQLDTVFSGVKSTGENFKMDFVRPFYRPDKGYCENEVIRYFEDWDRISSQQKKYVLDTMSMFAVCGLLQTVRKSEGTAALGNVRHGASGVTGVRTGFVTLDKEEFEKEVNFYKRCGALMAIQSPRAKPYVEVRINLVVAHEFGHQVEFCMSQLTMDRVHDIFAKRLRSSERLYPPPEDLDGGAELLLANQVENRVFISGYAKSSVHEYFAEAVAAFAVKDSRDELKKVDPEIHEILTDVILNPTKVLSIKFHEPMLNLRTSLWIGGEYSSDLLDK